MSKLRPGDQVKIQGFSPLNLFTVIKIRDKKKRNCLLQVCHPPYTKVKVAEKDTILITKWQAKEVESTIADLGSLPK